MYLRRKQVHGTWKMAHLLGIACELVSFHTIVLHMILEWILNYEFTNNKTVFFSKFYVYCGQENIIDEHGDAGHGMHNMIR